MVALHPPSTFRLPRPGAVLKAGAASALTLGAVDLARSAWTLPAAAPGDHSTATGARVSIIIPTLQEGARIAATVAALRALDPAPTEIIVADGGSTDGTVRAAKKAGAKVVRVRRRGRGAQMNAGARAAAHPLLWFVHADSRPPAGGVAALRRAMRDPATVAGGFTTLILEDAATVSRPPGGGQALCLSMTVHNWASTFYAPILARPLSFAAGLRALFGDQSIFCRAADFERVGGYRGELPLMEDLSLVMDLHRAGPADRAAHGVRALWVAGPRRGRVRQLAPPAATTSGRRFQAWGSSVKATAIHFAVALSWYAGVPAHVLEGVVRALYPPVSEVR